MSNDVTATFGGDIGPMTQAMASLRAHLEANHKAVEKDLNMVFKPQVAPEIDKGGMALVQAQFKAWASKPIPVEIKPVVSLNQSFSPNNLSLPAVQRQDRSAGNAGSPGIPASGAGGLRGFQIQNIGYQIQDIAVQAQMGTRMATIIGQQGSQLASVFGTGGVILGGILAIGGALGTVAFKAKDAFDEMVKGSREVGSEMDKLVRSGGIDQLGKAFEDTGKRRDEALKSRADIYSISNIMGMAVGGAGFDERKAQAKNTEARIEFDRAAIVKRIVDLSGREYEIAMLKAKGRTQEAEAAERQLAAEKKIAEINASDLPSHAKRQLIANDEAIRKAEDAKGAKEQLKTEQEKAKVLKDHWDKLKGMADENDRARAGDFTGADKLNDLNALQAKRKEEAKGKGYQLNKDSVDSVVRLGVGRGDFAVGEQALKALKDYEATMREIDKLTADMRKAAADSSKEKTDKAETVKLAKDEYKYELAIAQARKDQASSGSKDSSLVNKLEDELKIQKETKSIKDAQNVSDAQALNLARQKVDAERQIANAVLFRQNAEANKMRADTTMVDHLRAHGHRRQADAIVRQDAVDKATKDIMASNPGMDEQTARKQAERHQHDLDKLSGSRRIHGGVSKDITSNAMDDFYDRNPQLRRGQKPGFVGPPVPAGAAAQAANAKAKAAANAQAQQKQGNNNRADSLLQEMTKLLSSIEKNLLIAN